MLGYARSSGQIHHEVPGTFFTGLFRESGDYFHEGGVRLGATMGKVVKQGAGGTVGLVGAEAF